MKAKMHCKSIFALLLAVVMVVSMIPATALPVDALDYTGDDGSFYYSGFDGVNEGDETKWNVSETTVTDGVATIAGSTNSRLNRVLSTSAITKDFTLKFSIQMSNTGTTDGRAYIELGTDLGDSSTIRMQFLGGHDNRNDGVRIYKGNLSDNSYHQEYLTTKRVWHDIQIDVSPASGTFSVTVDGVEKAADFSFATGGSFIKVGFRSYNSGTINIKNFEVFTSDMEGAYDWTVNGQAALGENIGFTCSGKAGSMTGVTSVRATVGTTVATGNVVDGAYSFTLPVAASQMGETITLEGLDASGNVVKTETYTVAQYLADVKASNETTYGNIVDYTLNYGSAAATYFGGTSVTAPEGLTLSDVPNGDSITLTHSTSVVPDLNYSLDSAIAGDYTVEFKYQLQNSSSNFTMKIGPGNSTTTSNLWVRIRGGSQTGNIYSPTYNATASTTADDYATLNVWHTFKVTVNSTNKTFNVWLDGTKITDATNYTTGDFPCFSSQSTMSLGVVTFDMPESSSNRTVMIDDFKIYSGDGSGTPYYCEHFENFAVGDTANGTWSLGTGSTVTQNALDTANSPVSGTCTGVNVLSANLLFEDRVKVRYKVQLDAGKSIDSYTVKVGGVAVDAADIVAAGDNTYYIYSAGINPQMYGTDVVLTVSDGTETVTVAYSPMDYIQRMSAKDGTKAELKTLLKAMYNYYLAAKAYLSNSNS